MMIPYVNSKVKNVLLTTLRRDIFANKGNLISLQCGTICLICSVSKTLSLSKASKESERKGKIFIKQNISEVLLNSP